MSDAEVFREVVDQLAGEPTQPPADGPFAPFVLTDRLSCAVIDRRGGLLHADGLFLDADLTEPLEAIGALEAAGRPRAFEWRHPSGLEMPVAFGRAQAARAWVLSPAAREALSGPEAYGVLLTAGAWRAEGALQEVCAAYGVSPAQARVVAALVRTGEMRRAAQASGVAYETARDLAAEAMERIGVRKHAALITRVVSQTFGVLPAGAESEDILKDLWGLTPRQAGLALAVARGASRAEAALAVGISEAAAKKALADIFLSAGVTSVGGLSRKVADAMSLQVLARATRGDVAGASDLREPLGFALRPGGGAIAFSDYGPRGGAPVLVVHTSFSSRPVPHILVETLQAAGCRPLALDRPGFGLTDPAPADISPIDQAIADLETVMRRLKLARIDVICRGGFHMVRRLAETRPDLVGRIVLTAVPPPGKRAAARRSFYALVQKVSAAQPHLLRDLARACARLFPISDIRRNIIDAVKGCPADVAVIDDPRHFADYWRGLRMFATGRIEGYLREQPYHAAPETLRPLADASAWTVLQGGRDSMFDPDETDAWWRGLLPGARFVRLEEAGRLLVFSHPAAVAQALAAPPAPVVSDAGAAR